MLNFFPLYVDLRGKKCVVIGGGGVAYRKAKALLLSGARVLLVSPAIIPELGTLVAGGEIEYLPEAYQPSHLEKAFLVVSCTGDAAVNRRVARDCFSSNVLVNVADDPALCNFFFPSLVSRGPLSIAICTEGRSPALARLLREKLETLFDAEYGRFVEFLGDVRALVLREVSSPEERREIFKKLADDDFWHLFKSLPPEELEGKVKEILSVVKGEVDVSGPGVTACPAELKARSRNGGRGLSSK